MKYNTHIHRERLVTWGKKKRVDLMSPVKRHLANIIEIQVAWRSDTNIEYWVTEYQRQWKWWNDNTQDIYVQTDYEGRINEKGIEIGNLDGGHEAL